MLRLDFMVGSQHEYGCHLTLLLCKCSTTEDAYGYKPESQSKVFIKGTKILKARSFLSGYSVSHNGEKAFEAHNWTAVFSKKY